MVLFDWYWPTIAGTVSAKSSKSVAFTYNDVDNTANLPKELTGLMIEPRMSEDRERLSSKTPLQSISMKLMSALAQAQGHRSQGFRREFDSDDDLDLWLTFLIETGMIGSSDPNIDRSDTPKYREKIDDPESILKQLTYYHTVPSESFTTRIRDEYENIHRECPGLFWNVVSMDDPDAAFVKVKKIIKDIVLSQPNLMPMFDIEFSNMDKQYPFIAKKLADIANDIAPMRLFF